MYYIEGEVYLPTKLRTEDDFESLIADNASEIFPGFYLFPTKKRAKTSITQEWTHCDLCLISKTCEQWFVIEVELQKGDGYSKSHIRNQLAKQSDADWSGLANDMKKRLNQLGVGTEITARLDKVDWGFMLIIDEYSESVKRVSHDYGFELVVLNAIMNNKGGYGLILDKNHSEVPQISSEPLIKVSSKSIRTLAGYLYVNLPQQLVEKISNCSQSMVDIDGKMQEFELNHLKQLEIQITPGPDSSTGKLAYKKIDAGFHVEEESDTITLRFEEIDNWN